MQSIYQLIDNQSKKFLKLLEKRTFSWATAPNSADKLDDGAVSQKKKVISMRVNSDFSVPVTIHKKERKWVASPAGGVERCMLDRVGGEVARATSLVRFAAGSSFPTHTHDGGEEYLVLEGTFSDETGDFPAGTYVRNPIGTSHAPHTEEGCTIFVKLHQFAPNDKAHFKTSVHEGSAELHRTAEETVQIVELNSDEAFQLDAQGGAEFLVLAGSALLNGTHMDEGSWSRQPKETPCVASAQEDGTKLWIKSGHLTQIRLPEGEL